MHPRHLALIAGGSYVAIFFLAIFANFVALESLKAAPLETVMNSGMLVRLGILAFLLTAVFDTFVAWALADLYPAHPLTRPSTYFRLMHAITMGVAVFALTEVFSAESAEGVLAAVSTFNNIWLIGLFFFGVHLLLLARIVRGIRIIPYLLAAAGVMYMVDTSAHILLPTYDAYAGIFLALVAIPSILGEMSFALWLLIRGGREAPREK